MRLKVQKCFNYARNVRERGQDWSKKQFDIIHDQITGNELKTDYVNRQLIENPIVTC